MKSILAAIIAAMSELKTKADSALAGMGPVDQYQGAQEVAYAIKSLGYSKDVIESVLKDAAAVMEKYDTNIAVEAEPIAASMIAAKIEAGELINKTDHELAIDNAKKQGEQAAAQKFEDQKKADDTIAARRAELTSAHGQPVADAMAPEVLAAEKFDTEIKPEIARRVDSLTMLGVVAAEKPDQFKEILTCGEFTTEGSAAFDKRIDLITSLLPKGAVAASAPAKKAVVPGSGASQFAAASTAATPVNEEVAPAIF